MLNEITIAQSDREIAACFPVMAQLRPALASAERFVERVRGQMTDGYRLAALREGGAVRAVAGFRIGHNLAWGRFLYVDDLVTDAAARSCGHGAALLDWLKGRARAEGCVQLHLDSGLQRTDAHRFYEREGLVHVSRHFFVDLD